MVLEDFFEIKCCDLGGRIGKLRTKTSQFETPALLPVIHPIRQRVPCTDIRRIGYAAVMTNAYTTYTKLRGDHRSIHEIIGFDGSVMTDSGGYQVLEFGSVEVSPEDIARFEESIGSDIPVILDKPTGLKVSRSYAMDSVKQTLEAAKITKKVLTLTDRIWTLPIQGGKYLDLVRKSARESAPLGYDCFALGSPVEVMDDYDFALLAKMIIAARSQLPINKPFHLFGSGHPLILPLAVALGCDMFDSASYMLYAKKDRYISPSGTIRLEQLEYLNCSCEVCSSFTARELRSTDKEDRINLLAKHNLAVLHETMLEIKQAIWEGRLWELVSSVSRKHPKALEAFKACTEAGLKDFDFGTPRFKDRGVFVFDKTDYLRPEIRRCKKFLGFLDLSNKTKLLILPETKTKPFLKSDIFEEVFKIISGKADGENTLVAFVCPNYGLVPAEISDIYPLSQTMNATDQYPLVDTLLNCRKWQSIFLLMTDESLKRSGGWIKSQLASYFNVKEDKITINQRAVRLRTKSSTTLRGARSYRAFKNMIRD